MTGWAWGSRNSDRYILKLLIVWVRNHKGAITWVKWYLGAIVRGVIFVCGCNCLGRNILGAIAFVAM